MDPIIIGIISEFNLELKVRPALWWNVDSTVSFVPIFFFALVLLVAVVVNRGGDVIRNFISFRLSTASNKMTEES